MVYNLTLMYHKKSLYDYIFFKDRFDTSASIPTFNLFKLVPTSENLTKSFISWEHSPENFLRKNIKSLNY